MPSRPVRGLLAALALLLSACAVRPGINPTVESDELTPPTPIGGMAGGPALVGATVQQPVNLDILVQIDTTGRADLSTLQITGPGADANRQPVADWLRTARFEPARLNGYPVRGWFRVAAEAKASSVRQD
ncbi:MAG: hypothetical protein HOQ17_00390 [Gemmatimonadaceae bacterium]|nr:hypothetical protein [Gemmatimonadaceae bacterium]NUO94652.1 hypothetical protein [Gemmatimonadaceae bacterium]NUP57202.1 hypothetical protein [Gemmatimonadaceae bacterium]NUP70554.1 hypothetical protein [Gemmatimonadaceae bacterium]NUR33117.1 hypothetical protein [Gemmatimonadaceae bacterium]